MGKLSWLPSGERMGGTRGVGERGGLCLSELVGYEGGSENGDAILGGRIGELADSVLSSKIYH